MWTAIRTPIEEGERVSIDAGGARLSLADVLEGWRSNADFCDAFTAMLAATPFAAFFWEMPPIRISDLDQPYEYVAMDAPELYGVVEDEGPFSERLATAPSGAVVITFTNLSGQASLVVPRPNGAPGSNAQIATFARCGPASQQRALLALVAEQARARLSDRPIWISTSGLGVHWLHVRIEDDPVYYMHEPYREVGACVRMGSWSRSPRE
jgi:hypothetical protein